MKNIAIAALMLLAISPAQAAISAVAWGGVDGKGVDLFTLTNKSGMEVKITNYGGVITSIKAPDRSGAMARVVLGYESLEDYTSTGYGGRYGAIIGRFANRIKNNSFAIGGVNYKISRDAYVFSDAPSKPYDELVWTAQPVDGDEPQLV
ncbi:MAG: Aldose 1-epimerase, partial [Alphaproteobacteria bacterium]|nr:Aldose 1-epimerase [Alphaproteobacteria bacterium]